ncbi:phosphate ABC transporter ATP-binding protein PstB [Chondromyces crocatus]|uniref:Phosphate ABC transporter ATP-binding protein n=1 Tax=Chondromyces crocatus TaxID=52 RepID=A0A0K1ELE8_CHOCO|nr:phosphate ABC transporter ATP-binding protein PstB [Chondromyces crocatus]AKT41438.1 phosphate ABC transporter ATP-binding protein [Chondromyces crocatus]
MTAIDPEIGAESAPATKLQVTHLNAYFGDLHVIRDITLGVPAEKVTAIIGPSGCGKSTFLRCLNRMHEHVPGARAKGEVLLDGVDVYHPSVNPVRLRRRVGMVFQKPNPFPTMSIRDNVLAGHRLNGTHIDAPGELVEHCLRQVALWDEVKDRLDQPGIALSSGQQQRLCIARVLAVEPDVVLLDEPCSALDPIATAHIEELIEELKDRYTLLLVTHNLQQAARVSDYMAFFYMGNLVEFDRTDVIFTNPKESRTEDYVTGKFG